MFGLEISTLVFLAIATVVVVGGIYYANVRRKSKGPVTAQQIRLKIEDDADALREKITEGIRAWAAAQPEPTLKDHYFDSDDFLMDVGRLPATFPSAVTLDGAVKRNGSNPAQAFTKDEATGNVRRSTPIKPLPDNQ